jgi:hypothetical protein
MRGGFIISLPENPIGDARDFAADFAEQIRVTIDNPKEVDKSIQSPSDQTDDWAEVDHSMMNVSLNTTTMTDRSSAPSVDRPTISYLPISESLAKPEELLSRPPYHLHVRAVNRSCIEIQCSHSPTLEVLFSYLQKWCRVDSNMTSRVSQSVSFLSSLWQLRHIIWMPKTYAQEKQND